MFLQQQTRTLLYQKAAVTVLFILVLLLTSRELLQKHDLVPSGPIISETVSHISSVDLEIPPDPIAHQTPLPDRVVVVGKYSTEDTSWIAERLPDWQHAIYVLDIDDNSTAALHTPINKGKEAMSYLTYIIDNYLRLPSTIAFIPSHEDTLPAASHTDTPDSSNAGLLKSLKIDFVQANGYANLRCAPVPGCPNDVRLLEKAPENQRPFEVMMPYTWAYFFPGAEMPAVIAVPRGSRFAVSSDRVRQRSIYDYIRYRHWLMTTGLDDEESGRTMEYLWHLIFGMTSVYCPSYEQCQCEVFGNLC